MTHSQYRGHKDQKCGFGKERIGIAKAFWAAVPIRLNSVLRIATIIPCTRGQPSRIPGESSESSLYGIPKTDCKI